MVAESGSSVGPGRRPDRVVQATQMDVAGLTPGSAVLQVEPHRARQPELVTSHDSLLERSVDIFLRGLSELRAADAMPSGFDRGVIHGVVSLGAGIGHGVTAVSFARPGERPVVLDEGLRDRARRIEQRFDSESVSVTGRLHMGDFAPDHLRCRIDTTDGPIACVFDQRMRDRVLDMMDRLVVAEGMAEYWPREASPRHLELTRLLPIEEAAEPVLEDLVDDQQVQRLGRLEDLAAPDGDQLDGFVELMTSLRQT